ncbi:MAG: preprotein translocase subunit SecG [bacterium]
MTLDKILTIVQVGFGILLMAAVLVQARGASLGESFGGSGVFYGTRRGPERILFFITIGLAAVFVALSFVILLV